MASDVGRGYYTAADAAERFGVVLRAETFAVDEAATAALRSQRRSEAAE